jgi:acyl phosphate:glycerol-3-phosphate acyltransferase
LHDGGSIRDVSELLFKAALSYLLGSVIGSLVVGRFRGGVDIRQSGSGNAGGTNALRTQGPVFAFWVMLIDVGKGWLATAVIAPWALPAPVTIDPLWHQWCAPVCGLAVLLGHVYPLWYGFRGGKGVATMLGAVAGIGLWLLPPLLLAWLVTAVLTGFVGLASMVAAVALAVAIELGATAPHAPLLAFGILTAFLILYTHRGNIARMRAGTEPRARKLWLFGTRRTHLT